MTKRSNEDPNESEPAAKRSHAAESQQDLLLRAQASLDRLDFKTAEQLCSSVSPLEELNKSRDIFFFLIHP